MLTVILAGGRSCRMGREKARLPFQNSAMLQVLIDRDAKALGPVAVSVDEAGRFAFTGAAELLDPAPGQGPLNGLISGFAVTFAPELFLTATDLPLGDPALVKRLAALRGSADACLLRWDDGTPEPLFAVYGKSCLPAARAVMEQGRRSMRAMLETVSVRYVSPAELQEFDLTRILKNINTLSDYVELGLLT